MLWSRSSLVLYYWRSHVPPYVRFVSSSCQLCLKLQAEPATFACEAMASSEDDGSAEEKENAKKKQIGALATAWLTFYNIAMTAGYVTHRLHCFNAYSTSTDLQPSICLQCILNIQIVANFLKF